MERDFQVQLFKKEMEIKFNRKFIFIILFLISAFVLSFIINYFIFNIYEVIVETTPDHLSTDQNSTVKIEMIPINALGYRAPFRKVECNFKIIEGNDLVEIIRKDEPRGYIILRSKGMKGKVAIVIKTRKSLLPSYVEIQILPNLACKNSFLTDKVI